MRAVNLLPPDTRGASKVSADLGAGPEAKGGAGPFVVLGVLAACVAGVAGLVLTDNTVKQRKADLAEATVRQQALANQAAQLKPYADYDANARARVQTVKDLATSRFDWEQALRDLSRAIPQDITLNTLTGDIDTSVGKSTSPLRSAITAPAITLEGCAPGQTEVARLMSRLNDIDGVTRVSLAKSVSTLIKPTESSESEIKLRNAQPCGTGKRPDFSIVVFFEKASKAVAGTPTTSTGTVATVTPTPTPSATSTPQGTAASKPAEEGATK